MTRSTTARQVVVVGAGIAGLMAALALRARDFQVTVLERDPSPPSDGAAEWIRAGVPHAVQPHFFMGRLRNMIRDSYPRLMDRILAAGVGERGFVDYVHPLARGRYHAEVSDELLTALTARRTVFERLVRDYVQQENVATIVTNAAVTQLIFAPGERPLRVCGVVAEVGNQAKRFEAEAVLDASGRSGRLRTMLVDAGVRFHSEEHQCHLLYFTRRYRLKPGRSFPPTAGLPGAIFRDFILGALPADNGTFTVTLQVFDSDAQFIALAKDPDRFQALCERLPTIAKWVDADSAEPLGGVHGFGNMDFYWSSTLENGEPQVLGLFQIGDTVIRSNPKFGRGCTWAAVGVHRLAEILAQTGDPRERLCRYEQILEREFRSDWQTMLSIDQASRRGFEIAAGRRRSTLRDKLSFRFDALVNDAMITDPVVFRAIWSGYHGLVGMSAWTRRPEIWLRLLGRLVMGPGKFRPTLARQHARPSRQEIFALEASASGFAGRAATIAT